MQQNGIADAGHRKRGVSEAVPVSVRGRPSRFPFGGGGPGFRSGASPGVHSQHEHTHALTPVRAMEVSLKTEGWVVAVVAVCIAVAVTAYAWRPLFRKS